MALFAGLFSLNGAYACIILPNDPPYVEPEPPLEVVVDALGTPKSNSSFVLALANFVTFDYVFEFKKEPDTCMRATYVSGERPILKLWPKTLIWLVLCFALLVGLRIWRHGRRDY